MDPSNNSRRNQRLLANTDSNDFAALDMSDPSAPSSASFLPLPPAWKQRLFPPTVLARVLWLLAFVLLLIVLLVVGYEIGKRLAAPAAGPAPPASLSSSSSSSSSASPTALSSSTGSSDAISSSSSTAPPPPPPPSSTRSTVVLVSIDGFRASYLDDYPTLIPTLKTMQYAGSYAKRMQSCFPTTTFPNHWSIVTGLYTEEHGITSNNIYDPALNATFNMQTLDPRWWGGEPVWNTAMKQNLRANVMFWPGSEVLVQDMRPNQWFKFNDSTPNMDRINTVLGWLDQRSCDLCVTYISILDSAGHSGGPNSTQVRNTLPIIDSLIRSLLTGIASLGLADNVTVLLTSDHGMSGINVNRSVPLANYTSLSGLRITDSGAMLGVWPNDTSQANVDRIYAQLASQNPHMAVYQRATVPARLHYNNNGRIPPIVGMLEDGWVVSGARPYTNGVGGTHGYDPRYPSMGALWLGVGKGLKRGGVLDEVDNVNVYSLICHLLGIVPAKTSGSLEPWRPVLVAMDGASSLLEASEAVLEEASRA